VRIVVGLVLVILALSVVFLGRQVRHQDSLNSLRSSALADAATYGVYVSSYNYKNLDASNSPYVLAEDHSTPSFAAKLKSAEGPFDTVLKQVDSTSTAKVVGIGASSVTSSQAQIVLYIQQTTSSTEQKTPTAGPLWLQMTLVRLHGKWVMSDIIADNITGNS
jgi:Mce-associated membrane protein